MDSEIEQLKARVTELEQFMRNLYSNSSIPLEVGEAFRTRISGVELLASAKTAASETQAVNEAGSATYNVAKPPDGFLTGPDNRQIPFYN